MYENRCCTFYCLLIAEDLWCNKLYCPKLPEKQIVISVLKNNWHNSYFSLITLSGLSLRILYCYFFAIIWYQRKRSEPPLSSPNLILILGKKIFFLYCRKIFVEQLIAEDLWCAEFYCPILSEKKKIISALKNLA